MKSLIIILFLLFIISCQHNFYPDKSTGGGDYTIYGKINGIDTGTLYLLHIDTTGKLFMPALDSANLTNGFFLFRGQINYPEPCKIKLKYLERGWPYTILHILYWTQALRLHNFITIQWRML